MNIFKKFFKKQKAYLTGHEVCRQKVEYDLRVPVGVIRMHPSTLLNIEMQSPKLVNVTRSVQLLENFSGE